jgi:hypothetical protein
VDVIMDARLAPRSAIGARPQRPRVGVCGERGTRRPDAGEQLEEAVAMVEEHVQQATMQALR